MLPHEAATAPRQGTRQAKAVRHFPWDANICRAQGVKPDTLYQWRKRHPDDNRPTVEIVAEIAERTRREKLTKQRKAACKAIGIKWSTVRSRMRRHGMTFDEALAMPVMTKSEIGKYRASLLRGGV